MKSIAVTLHFSELLLALLKGKTGLLDALHILTREGINKHVKDSAFSLLVIMKKGKGLSNSLRIMRKGKVYFEPLYLTLITAAELTGNIEVVLERIVLDLQRRQVAKETIVNIMIYPAIIILLAAIGTIAIIVKGMPFFISGGLLSSDAINEAKTGLCIAGITLLSGGSALFIAYYKIFRNDSPESRIFYLLELLLKSHVTLPDALSQCIISLGYTKYGKAMVSIKKDIASGIPFSAAFAKTRRFSAYVLGWLSIADKHGNLNDICGNIRDYSIQKDNKIREIAAKLIEPAVIVLVGLYVLSIMLTVILPILSYSGGIL